MISMSVETANIIAMVILGVCVSIFIFALIYGLITLSRERSLANAWMREHEREQAARHSRKKNVVSFRNGKATLI